MYGLVGYGSGLLEFFQVGCDLVVGWGAGVGYGFGGWVG